MTHNAHPNWNLLWICSTYLWGWKDCSLRSFQSVRNSISLLSIFDYFFLNRKCKKKLLLFHAGKIPLVNKPPVIPLLDSWRNNISASNNSLKILASGIQEMNTHLYAHIHIKAEPFSNKWLITNVRKSLNIKYCRYWYFQKHKDIKSKCWAFCVMVKKFICWCRWYLEKY